MTELTLHYAVPSRGLTAHWMLEELGVPYTKNILSLDNNDHKTPEFLSMNPMGRVPVLTHGATVVTETAAIVAYLAETFGDAGFSVEPGAEDRGAYLRWLFFTSGSAEPSMLWESLGAITTERDYLPFADIQSVIHTLSSAVEDKQFVVADRFTAADVMLGSTIMWGLHLMPTLPELPALTEYWKHLEARPAWQNVWNEAQSLMGSS